MATTTRIMERRYPMTDNKNLYSQSETIGVVEQRKLIELGRPLNRMLTKEEFLAIASVYNGAINRLLKENGEEE